MATVIQGQPSKGQQNTAAIGGALAKALEGAWGGYTQHHDQRAIQDAVHNLPKNASPRDILDAVTNTRTYSPEAKQKALVNYLSVAQQAEQSRHARAMEETALARASAPKGAQKKEVTPEEKAEKIQDYVDRGMSPLEAKIAANASPALEKEIYSTHSKNLSQETYDQRRKEQEQEFDEKQDAQNKEILSSKAPNKDPWPKIRQIPLGETPKQVADLKKEYRSENAKRDEGYTKAAQTYAKSRLRLNGIDKANEAVKELGGLQNFLLIDDDGQVRPIASKLKLVPPEVQLLIKEVSEALSGAKDFVAGRVSGFEFGLFGKTLPSMMNTKLGRKLIVKSLRIKSELDFLRDKTTNEVIQHYGRDAPPEEITRVVNDRMTREEERLEKQQDVLVKGMMEQTKAINGTAKEKADAKGKTLMHTPKGTVIWVRDADVKEALENGIKQW
jgi:hypothetical protein